MNRVIVTGNLAADPEIRQTQSGIKCAQFRIAVRRAYKNAEGKHEADFLNVVAWRGTAEIVEKFARKGNKLGVVGVLQTRSYDGQDGQKRYITEIIADEVELMGSANREQAPMPEPPIERSKEDAPTDFAQDDDDELPFL